MTKIRNQKSLTAFGKRIAQLRKKKGLSQYSLAAEANISRSQITSIEKGEVNTTLSTIIAIAEGLGVNPKDLLDFTP